MDMYTLGTQVYSWLAFILAEGRAGVGYLLEFALLLLDATLVGNK